MTYTVMIKDKKAGEMGVVITSQYPAVGAVCLHSDYEKGLVSTQSMANPWVGHTILERLTRKSTQEAVESVLVQDPNRHIRQTLAMTWKGEPWAETGEGCLDFCDQIRGRDWIAAGNMLAGPEVLTAVKAGVKSSGSVAQRLLEALRLGFEAGGDKRGHTSAALRIIRPWTSHPIDIRIDDHEKPVEALIALYEKLSSSGVFEEFDKTIPDESGQVAVHPILSL